MPVRHREAAHAAPRPERSPPDPVLERHGVPEDHREEPNIVVGDFSYYDDSRGPEHFEARCVRYHFDFVGDRLIIGKFCAIAQGAQFVMNGANHP